MARAARGSASHHPAWLAGSSVGCHVTHTHTHPALEPELPEDPIPSLAEMMGGWGGPCGQLKVSRPGVGHRDSQDWASGGEGKSPPAGRWGRDLHAAQQRRDTEIRRPARPQGALRWRTALRSRALPSASPAPLYSRPCSSLCAPPPSASPRPRRAAPGREPMRTSAQSRVRLHFRRGPLCGRRGPRSRGRGGPERWRRTERVGEVPARPT